MREATEGFNQVASTIPCRKRQGVFLFPLINREFTINDHPFWERVEEGEWELPVIKKLIEVVKPSDTIFDVGAWIGPYTLLLSALARIVVAFEPYHPTREILIDNLKRNKIKNVVVEPFALSDRNTALPLYFYNPHNLDEILASSMMNMMDRAGKECSVFAATQTIDHYCERTGIRPDGLKIDVEGHEAEVLAGCSQDCWKLVECHRFARLPDIDGELLDADAERGHLFVSYKP